MASEWRSMSTADNEATPQMMQRLHERQREAWKRECKHPLDKYNEYVGELADLMHDRFLLECRCLSGGIVFNHTMAPCQQKRASC